MTFKRDYLLYQEIIIVCSILGVIAVSLIPFLGVGLSLLYFIPSIVCILISVRIHNTLITIDEVGISCYRGKKMEWIYEWEDIAELRKSSRFRLPTMEIMVHDDANKTKDVKYSGAYFQLSGVAKKAISTYMYSKEKMD